MLEHASGVLERRLLAVVAVDEGEIDRSEVGDRRAQRQLRGEGRIHNYLRMLWGKNILAWTPSPQDALAVMIELNNRYALDGRDPNSYSGIFWVLGRHDRAWGPERPIFGKVRYLAASGLERKCDIGAYVEKVTALCRKANGTGSAS